MSSKTKYLIGCALFLVVIVSVFSYLHFTSPSLKIPVETKGTPATMTAGVGAAVGQPVQCTYDSSICPDGTVLYRVGPKCDYPACPGTGSVSTTTGT
jgi:hypothetical protein